MRSKASKNGGGAGPIPEQLGLFVMSLNVAGVSKVRNQSSWVRRTQENYSKLLMSGKRRFIDLLRKIIDLLKGFSKEIR